MTRSALLVGGLALLFGAGLAASAGRARAQSATPSACDRCGPPPDYPTWRCSDPRFEGGRGPCVARADGTCGWVHVACPEAGGAECAAAECGPAPSTREWACAGSPEVASFGECRRGHDGRCGWVHRPCPAKLEAASAPAAPTALAADVALILGHLEHASPARRIAGCKLIRKKVRAHDVGALSEALAPRLSDTLADANPQVRLWAVQAMRVLDDRTLPALRARLAVERDVRVVRALRATVKQLETKR